MSAFTSKHVIFKFIFLILQIGSFYYDSLLNVGLTYPVFLKYKHGKSEISLP